MESKLLAIEQNDVVRLTIGGQEYKGHATYKHHEPWERIGGVPKRGNLSVDVELDKESVEQNNAASHSVSIRAKEKRQGQFELSEPRIWNPVVEDETIVEDRWDTLGSLESIEIMQDN